MIKAARQKFVVNTIAITLLLLGLIGVGLLVGLAVLGTEDDPKRIQGEWAIVSLRFNGWEMGNAPELAGMTTTFDAEVFRFGRDFRYAIIPGQSPKAIDMEVPTRDGVQMAHGVYEFDGDQLSIHLAIPPQPRPTTVHPNDESQSVMLVLRRVSKQ